MSKPFRAAHWTRVTSEISSRFGLDFKASKRAYDALKTRHEKTPTLTAIRSLDRLPVWARRAAEPERFEKLAIKRAKRRLPAVEREYQAAQKRLARAGEQPRLEPSTGPVEAGSKLLQAPRAILPRPARINTRLKPKNALEAVFAENRVPLQVARNPSGKLLNKAMKTEPEKVSKLARLMGIGHRQIARDYGMSKKVKSKIASLLESIFPQAVTNEIKGMYHQILKACYGKGKGKGK